MSTMHTRRDFVKGAATVGIAMGSLAAAGTALADETAAGLPETWDAEADIIVVGYGGAGAAAAITAGYEELGSCIVLEAAPEGEEGGNSRVCGQNLLIPQDIEQAMVYQKNLNSTYVISEDPEEEEALYRSWATALHENRAWLEELGCEVTDTTMNSHEFPEVEGNELGGTCCLVNNTVGNEAVWNLLKEQEEYLGMDVRYGTRAVKLVRNPQNNEALGVIAETLDGQELCFKAKKGILLSCGGFENNPQMVRTYGVIGSLWDGFYGTPYNRGDGFKMIAPFGAQLRNMNSATGPNWGISASGEDSPVCWFHTLSTKEYIYVGPNGKRFFNEEFESTTRHGKFNINGIYQPQVANSPAYCIFGQNLFDAGPIMPGFSMGWCNLVTSYIANENQGLLEAGVIKKGDTVEELAEQIGYDPETLAETVRQYNEYAVAGVDQDFHREAPILQTQAKLSSMGLDASEVQAKEEEASAGAQLVPIEGPFYAFKLRPCVGANTQGGPKRDANGQVLDVENNPIPRLFAAGEFGSIYAFMYNGGGNLSDAIGSGRLAARSIGALEPWC